LKVLSGSAWLSLDFSLRQGNVGEKKWFCWTSWETLGGRRQRWSSAVVQCLLLACRHLCFQVVNLGFCHVSDMFLKSHQGYVDLRGVDTFFKTIIFFF
jgi:hypothetical protein